MDMEYGKAGPAGGNQGAECLAAHISLINNQTPPVSGALGEIGLCSKLPGYIGLGDR